MAQKQTLTFKLPIVKNSSYLTNSTAIGYWARDVVAPALELGYSVTIDIDQHEIRTMFENIDELPDLLHVLQERIYDLTRKDYRLNVVLPDRYTNRIHYLVNTSIKLYKHSEYHSIRNALTRAIEALVKRPWWEECILANHRIYRSGKTTALSNATKTAMANAITRKEYPPVLNTSQSLPVWIQCHDQLKTWPKEATSRGTCVQKIIDLLSITTQYKLETELTSGFRLHEKSTDAILWRNSLDEPDLASAWLEYVIQKNQDNIYASTIPTAAHTVFAHYSGVIKKSGNLLDAQIPERWLLVSMGLRTIPDNELDSYAYIMIAQRNRQHERESQNPHFYSAHVTIPDYRIHTALEEKNNGLLSQRNQAARDVNQYGLDWSLAVFNSNMNEIKRSPAIRKYAIEAILSENKTTISWILNTFFNDQYTTVEPSHQNVEMVLLQRIYPGTFEHAKNAVNTFALMQYKPSVDELEMLIENMTSLNDQPARHNGPALPNALPY